MGEDWEDPRVFFKTKTSNITWAHAVNNKQKLSNALLDGKIMMLEADVSLIPSKNQTPMMAHSPSDTSDLSLEDFIKTIIDKKTKQGIKIDFKSIDAFNASIPILTKYKSNMTFPVFLNADILSGPNATNVTPVDAKLFLNGAKTVLPKSILSIGWTTSAIVGNYTEQNINEMLKIIETTSITQMITYPVRASLAVNSLNVLSNLINKTSKNNSTLTIWTAENDVYNSTLLNKLINDIGIDKVYVDLPTEKSSATSLAVGTALTLICYLLTGFF